MGHVGWETFSELNGNWLAQCSQVRNAGETCPCCSCYGRSGVLYGFTIKYERTARSSITGENILVIPMSRPPFSWKRASVSILQTRFQGKSWPLRRTENLLMNGIYNWGELWQCWDPDMTSFCYSLSSWSLFPHPNPPDLWMPPVFIPMLRVTTMDRHPMP